MNGIASFILTTMRPGAADSDGLNWSRLRSVPSFVIKGVHEFPSVLKCRCSSGLARARTAVLNLPDPTAMPGTECFRH